MANGNALDGTNDPANVLGYVTLDSATETGPNDGLLTVTGIDGTSGTFTVNSVLFPSGYTSFVLGFSATVAQVNPDSYLFSLPAGVFSGAWSITTGDPSKLGSLTRAYIYGMPAPVPLPAAAWLLLSGLAGVGVVARRRTRSEARLTASTEPRCGGVSFFAQALVSPLSDDAACDAILSPSSWWTGTSTLD